MTHKRSKNDTRIKTTLKHTLMAASLSTLFAATAHAASDGFSFYGLIDGGIATTSIKGGASASKTEFVTGGYAPNFVGLTAQKSVGDLKGGVQVEQGFLLNNNPCGTTCTVSNSRYWFGDDSIANRRANVYVEGKYGTARLGTQGNIAFSSVLMAEPRFGSNFGSALAAVDIDGGLGTNDNSALSYTSPTFGGLSGAISLVSSQRTNTAGSTNSGTRFAGTYKKDAFGATLAYYKNNISTGRAANGTIAGATYKIKDFTIKGLYVKQDNGGALTNLRTAGLGGAWEATPDLTIDLGMYSSSDSGGNYQQKTLGFGAQYKIIKDLSLYAQYANVKNNKTATAAYNFAGPTILSGNVLAGQSATTLNVGALFSFF